MPYMTKPSCHGIPGLVAHDHVGITVPDIELAKSFLVSVIGADHIYDLPSVPGGEPEWAQIHLGVPAGARIKAQSFLRLGPVMNIELFEYEAPQQVRTVAKNSDVGGHHIALYTEQFDAAISYLRAHNITLLGEPTIRETGPNAGVRWIYFLAPWGMQWELIEYPNGKAYQKETIKSLWDPRSLLDA